MRCSAYIENCIFRPTHDRKSLTRNIYAPTREKTGLTLRVYCIFILSQFTDIQYTGSAYPAFALLSAKIVRTARVSDPRDTYTYCEVSRVRAMLLMGVAYSAT